MSDAVNGVITIATKLSRVLFFFLNTQTKFRDNRLEVSTTEEKGKIK